MTDQDRQKRTFQFFNEIGIIYQLGTALFNKQLPDELHISHFAVLNHFVRLGDGATPRDLARAFQVTKGTMTHTLSALSGRGLIRVEPHASDKRSKLVFLTAGGRAFHSRAIERLVPVFDMMARNMDLARLDEIVPVLADVRAVLDQNRDH